MGVRPWKSGMGIALLVLLTIQGLAQRAEVRWEFYGHSVVIPAPEKALRYQGELSPEGIRSFGEQCLQPQYQPYLDSLLAYREQNKPDHWIYYQAIRKMAQQLCPKAEDYTGYTIVKWWLLNGSGYQSKITTSGQHILLYVQSDEVIYDIPFRMENGQQFVCLNYHDYGQIDFNKFSFMDVGLPRPVNPMAFSYKVNQLPEFDPGNYMTRNMNYSDGIREYAFRIRYSPEVKTIFKNYPVVDYGTQFNLPLSRATHESLIPSLKKQVSGMKPRDGVAFLMRFTRYAFLFKPDHEVFGGEKRLGPEQTLLAEYSDCEDRAALFFYLVREIYDLPMIVLTYPQHVTVAVQLDKAYGKTITYNGERYTICEPSPQREDLNLGETIPNLDKQAYQVAYAYHPAHNK